LVPDAERQDGLAEPAACRDHGEVHPESESKRAAQLGCAALVSFEGERLVQLTGGVYVRESTEGQIDGVE
jgi:hypothetical protein